MGQDTDRAAVLRHDDCPGGAVLGNLEVQHGHQPWPRAAAHKGPQLLLQGGGGLRSQQPDCRGEHLAR